MQIALILSLSTVVSATKKTTDSCQLKIFKADSDHWHDLTEGFLFALIEDHTSPDCKFCDKIGNSTGDIQFALADLE